jgi:hypothetical protein
MTTPNPPGPPPPSPNAGPPSQPWIGNGPPARRQTSVWNVLGLVVGAVLAVVGLFAVAAFFILFVGLNNWGNNK